MLSRYDKSIIRKIKNVFPDFEYTYIEEHERFPRFEGTINSININIVQFDPITFLHRLDDELFTRLIHIQRKNPEQYSKDKIVYNLLCDNFRRNNNGALY